MLKTASSSVKRRASKRAADGIETAEPIMRSLRVFADQVLPHVRDL
jgi:hypothetical protein